MAREGYPNLKDRPSGWKDKVKPKLDMIMGWARHGATNQQIALNLGIGQSTFDAYLREHEELVDALNAGREDAEIIVENALFKKATGYKAVERTKERRKVLDEDGKWTGEWEMVTTKKAIKHIQPDVNAIQYWLEHRAPHRWEKNPLPGIDQNLISAQLLTLAQLVQNPVREREIGSENE